MRDLIRQLSDQHLDLRRRSLELKEAQSHMSPDQFWKEFKAFRNRAIEHLDFEDKELYSSVEYQLEANGPLLTEQANLVVYATEFFSWWPTPESLQGEDFALALDTFLGALKARMEHEESVVFTLYRPVAATQSTEM